ncbi:MULTISPECIES: MFS transporter [Rhizobium/Agrobacterium group]|jgi:MFS family permease|uniref:MFS transporter n=1 Tax=Rhizobium/Agrobacterium group TaxID=227290 RepID=UPI0003F2159A|nr:MULTISPECIES: MFS transporter [Rhizobium/Agrobacterium group]AHK04083.1 ABC transporter, permease protein [Agrobacterium tumefaciens LBA4213 (Ach5)]AKC09826.1 ABC transporter permease [Agrobacterium tumefaciens]AYM18970.1 ABC transporter permease [Agrobacterium tumefaciens]AYM70269.1 ABC transporter permease [Agrobacterium tumefaciens]NIB59048.1 MFS transporter [Agrobacterium tumefaciens]
MSNPYREIFRAPGAKGFSAAGFFARLPIAMAPIGIVAMLSQTHGEYWLAGAVSATFALTNAAVAPQISRLVDRKGQSSVLVPATIISVIAFAILIIATNQRWPAWTLFLSAFLAAAMPSIPAMMRARWTEIFRDRPELNTAFAFESAADELVYIAGASLSVGLAVSLFPEAGMMISTASLALGTFAFLLQRSTEPKVRAVESGSRQHSAIRLRSVQIITVALIFVGSTFATAEVSAVAITKELGQPEAASLVIGVYAIGSFVVGLLLGAINPKMPLQRQLLIAVSVLALTALPLLFASTTVSLLAFAVFLSGVAISPIFITAFGLIERRVPESMLTEGVTWVMTGIGIGMALGAFISGWVIDNFGPSNGFWVSIAATLSTVTIISLGQRSLSGETNRSATTTAVQPAE